MVHSTSSNPLFILALPRSGSTLLQRLLAAHPDIATTAEPNILLYPLQALRPTGTRGLHPHHELHEAVSQFVARLPGGRAAYLAAVEQFARSLYSAANVDGTRYFLDKSPAYSLVASEILEAFPDGRFVFLWRNPLAVASSMLRFGGRDPARWNLYLFPYLYEGLERLAEAFGANSNRVVAVQYEQLVKATKPTLDGILSYLQLSTEPDLEGGLSSVKIKGKFVDPNSRKPGYQSIRADTLYHWPLSLGNPLRRRWSLRYLDWIGPDRLRLMGYDRDALVEEVRSVPVSSRYLARDAWWMPYGALHQLVSARSLRANLVALRRGEPYYSYR